MGQAARERKEKEISRRKLIKTASWSALGLVAAGVIGNEIYQNTRPPVVTFQEAYHDEKKRDAWLQGLEDRSYATKTIATSEVLARLKKERDYTPPKGAYAVTFESDKTKLGKGATSELVVLPECFDSVYKRNVDDIAVIVGNVVENHELVHTDHFNKGIPGYDLKLFLNRDGKVKPPLFKLASEIIAYRSEHKGLRNASREFVRRYASDLNGLVRPLLTALQFLTRDKSLIARLEKEAQF